MLKYKHQSHEQVVIGRIEDGILKEHFVECLRGVLVVPSFVSLVDGSQGFVVEDMESTFDLSVLSFTILVYYLPLYSEPSEQFLTVSVHKFAVGYVYDSLGI